jgi:UDP-2,4-diacetamido-2,4,6-trideoxy-beta-L-altropyranose hydrolase
MSSKTILFRANSSSNIGTGHIMRDLVLAQKYAKKGHTIIFATQELDGNINHKIIESNFKLEILKDNTIEEFQKTIAKYNPNLIVIDSYDIDYEFEKRLKDNNQDIKLLCFDDTYERHYCDIILNHNISGDESKYKGLVPQNCELRCGAKYTLLREEFLKETNKVYKPNKKFTFFIAMGGADHSNINIDILEVLKEFDNIEVNLVTTTANQNLEALKEYVKDKEWIELYINSNQIAKLMRLSDFAIITPSVTLNEVFFMEVPFIAIKTADNQEDMAQYLIENRYSLLESFRDKELKSYIERLLYG